jgi:putative ABC transport system permease protein
VRLRRASSRAVAEVATAIRSGAPDLPYVEVKPLADLVNREAARWRMGATLFGLFGFLAVALAAVGIYAALGFSIRQRTPEIGVRVAFGANTFDIVSIVVRHALIVVTTGLIAGALVALAITRSFRSVLFGVAPGDVATFATASAIIAVVAFAGSFLPALRAARIDPAAALRTE